jgi:hypothetical protein
LSTDGHRPWPALPFDAWKDTLHAVHMWTQIVGKIRLATTPLVNHWWNSTLLVTPRGLTTGTMPTGAGAFQIDFDFVEHELTIVTSAGGRDVIPLRSMAIAQFYRELLDALSRLEVPKPEFLPVPNEVEPAVPFADDMEIRPYDRDRVHLFADALLRTSIVFERFRAGFLGKASPVQFFWGGFDLASARFSGRRAPGYAGGSAPNVHIHVMHEAYSHELVAAGFWVGSTDVPQAEYYAYAMPALKGFGGARVRPEPAAWIEKRGLFVLPYETVRASPDPEAAITAFLESTYGAAADLGRWDRALLEDRVSCDCDPVPTGMLRNGMPARGHTQRV